MKKNGFTLMELLAVIALIGILLLLIVPNVLSNLRESRIKAIQIEEGNVLNTSNIYLEDYCISPIDETFECPDTYFNNKYICLSDIVKEKMITNEIDYNGNICKGIIKYDENLKGKTYFACGNEDNGYFTDIEVYDGNNLSCE